MNRYAQFKVDIDGCGVHFIHEPGRGPNPKPLLLVHGWPGSVYEFQQIIPMLTDPAAHGGDPRDSFTIVAPSLPGYGFSDDPGGGMNVRRMAQVLRELMTDVLGYHAIRRTGRRLGSGDCFQPGLRLSRRPDRYPSEPGGGGDAGGAARPGTRRGRAAPSRRSGAMAARRDGVPPDSRHQAADAWPTR